MEADSINVEQYIKELAVVTMDLTKACGRMFEQNHFRFIAMLLATRTSGGGGGGGGGGRGFHRGGMEHKVIMYFRAPFSLGSRGRVPASIFL